MEERVETTTPSLRDAMAAELMIGSWFGIGAISAVKVVRSIVLKSL